MARDYAAVFQCGAIGASQRGEKIRTNMEKLALWVQKERKPKRPSLLFSEAGWKEKGGLIWDAVVLLGKRAKIRSELSVIWEKAINTLQTFAVKSKAVILVGEERTPCPSVSLSKIKKKKKKTSKVATRFSRNSMHSTHSESENAAPLCPSLCSSLAGYAGSGQEMLSPALGQNEDNQEVAQLPDPGGGAKDEKAGGAEGGTRRAQVMQQGGGSRGGARSRAVLDSSSQEKELTSSQAKTTKINASMSTPEKPDPARLKALVLLQLASTNSITLSLLLNMSLLCLL
ncbi:uncharacterized protein LOC134552829 [Prinia subflava]|uniref:uncharacterized protein LOC134552829 n=1 Tax=Prinia subflava TaxID=208062 RepID=UPI002FE177E7